MRDKFTPVNDNHDQVQALWDAICEEAAKHMSFFSWVLFQNTAFEEFDGKSLAELADDGDVDGLQRALDAILAEEAEVEAQDGEPVAV